MEWVVHQNNKNVLSGFGCFKSHMIFIVHEDTAMMGIHSVHPNNEKLTAFFSCFYLSLSPIHQYGTMTKVSFLFWS